MAGTRALVLGSGGVTGVAWQIGVLCGLARAGVDLGDADLVVGTSAGAVVGAQLRSGADLARLYAGQLVPGEPSADRMGPGAVSRVLLAAVGSRDGRRARARIGRYAVAAAAGSRVSRRPVFEEALPVWSWPQRPLWVTGVDADSGDFVVFDASSGVDLVDAVSASCAVPGVWPPVVIGARRFVDGGMRSAANVDLAVGYAAVVVLAPIGWGVGHLPSVSRQAVALGSGVVVVSPDRAARRVIGRRLLDPARRVGAARAGRRQGLSVAGRVGRLWGGVG
ncbi:patatin-like phospholipase family protein [Micromonospora sp. NBC_01813]|uniref:patatin-like phospholipase family protein n=1 Tax=Micromonospora sp. NBC_01813 TaxID=2975988 RepID=UPI002DD91BEA|nr:patatin-like phospholipase family protein [Micromonospora sp. NBC_01813]WSA10465.1 patatin-like phospholipase family protein [Micromonospora sp. NBC_01813]